MLDAVDPDSPDTWIFHLLITWREDDANNLPNLGDVKAKSDNLCEPFRSAFAWVPEDTAVYASRISYWAPQPCDKADGRVTLAGDAAHPMTFREL